MGEASRRKKEGREVKDPLRFKRVTLESYVQRENALAGAYHQIVAARAALEKDIAASEAKLQADGHPLYQSHPETATAPEASASEEPSNDPT